MARLFVFGIGGTGSRVIKSLTMLLASGMKPGEFDEIVPIIIDPHKDLKELNDCKTLIKLYSSINSKINSSDQEIPDGFFNTKMTTLKVASSNNSLRDDIEFDDQQNETFGEFISKTGIKRKSPETDDFLSLLYSDKNFKQPLNVGFKGNPHMGSMVLNALFRGRAYNAFESVFGSDDRIFIISSVFGGTGAAGFPLLLQNLRNSTKPEIRNCKIGALSILPYFKLTEAKETSDIDSNDFMTKTKAALSYYVNPSFTKHFNSIYYLADHEHQTDAYVNDEKKQENAAHLIELLGATAIFDFANDNSSNRSIMKEYCINQDAASVNFTNLGNSTSKTIKTELTALHLFSKIHPLISKNANQLAFCKINDFNNSFFKEPFFKDKETGLEVFFNDYYSKWIKELGENQRSFFPYLLEHNETFNELMAGNIIKTNFWDNKFTKPIDNSDILNKISKSAMDDDVRKIKINSKHSKYLRMCWKGCANFVQTNY